MLMVAVANATGYFSIIPPTAVLAPANVAKGCILKLSNLNTVRCRLTSELKRSIN